jgi:hypothetical protein
MSFLEEAHHISERLQQAIGIFEELRRDIEDDDREVTPPGQMPTSGGGASQFNQRCNLILNLVNDCERYIQCLVGCHLNAAIVITFCLPNSEMVCDDVDTLVGAQPIGHSCADRPRRARSVSPTLRDFAIVIGLANQAREMRWLLRPLLKVYTTRCVRSSSIPQNGSVPERGGKSFTMASKHAHECVMA